MIENYLNGNLADAKERAKKFSCKKIHDALVSEFGFSPEKAFATAWYLKTGKGFQQACDTP